MKDSLCLKDKRLVALVTTVCLLGLASMSTGQKSHTTQPEAWSSPDKTFSLSVPVDPAQEKDPEFDKDFPNDEEKAIKFYRGIWSKCSFAITEIELTSTSARLPSRDKFARYKYFAGGYSDQSLLIRTTIIDNLHAQEVVLKESRAKGMIIDGHDRVFTLLWGPESPPDRGECINSPEAAKFFKSFKLLKRSPK